MAATATTTKRAMRPDDILRLRWLTDPQLSPDATRVAYVVTTLDAQKNEYRSQIKVVDAATGESIHLTNGPKRDTSPRWSPDGKQIAFISERGEEKAQVWVIGSSGGEARRLTKTEQAAANPAWSPDGRHIAFTSHIEGNPADKGPDGKPYPKVSKITTLKYKYNGEGLVQDQRNHLFLVDVDLSAGEPRDAVQLTQGDYNHGAARWSPDSKHLAFSSARHANRDRDAASDIWALDVSGDLGPAKPASSPKRLTTTKGPSGAPSWSPDGKEVAYLGHTDKSTGGARHYKLWSVPFAGGEPRCLTPDLDRNCVSEAPTRWSDDGRSIEFQVVDSGNAHVYRAPRGGGKAEAVVGGPRQVTASSAAKGATAFVASDACHPAEVFLRGADGQERALTCENAAWLEEVQLGNIEELKVVSADGSPVQAWVLRPRDVEGPVPCLLNVHGGPKGQYGNVFFDEFQVYAAAGYAVVFGNPRGSDGYTEQHALDVVGAWGDKDWQDVTAIADAIKTLPYVDQERVGIMGGSYGGFMTSWAVGHTDRFRAACSERAVNNAYSMVGTSDIGASFQVHHVGALPYKEPERFLQMSPIHYVNNIRTPLLILHSENDLRCPIEQAEQLYVGLKLLRRPVEFWRFPEDNHEMSRAGKPRNRLKRFEVILSWFGKQLAAPKR